MVIKCSDQQQVTDDQAKTRLQPCQFTVIVISKSAHLSRNARENSSPGCRQKYARSAGKLATCSMASRLAATLPRHVWTLVHIGKRALECVASPPFPISSLCPKSKESRSLCFCPLAAESSSVAPTCRKHSWLAGWSIYFVSSG